MAQFIFNLNFFYCFFPTLKFLKESKNLSKFNFVRKKNFGFLCQKFLNFSENLSKSFWSNLPLKLFDKFEIFLVLFRGFFASFLREINSRYIGPRLRSLNLLLGQNFQIFFYDTQK